jgi:predicted double-glycine peptidase
MGTCANVSSLGLCPHEPKQIVDVKVKKMVSAGNANMVREDTNQGFGKIKTV